MIGDQELAAAVVGRQHWQPTGEATAVYAPPGASATVLVQKIMSTIQAADVWDPRAHHSRQQEV